MDLLNKLNQAQKSAVTHINSPVLILAGAGSGKTRVISHKILYLIKKQGFLAKHITAITFTNKAAREMSERVNSLGAGVNTRGLQVSTFHALGLKILREEALTIGYKKNFSLLDGYDSLKIISDIVQTTDKTILKNIQIKISVWKNAFLSSEMIKAQAKNELEVLASQVYERYIDTLKAYQAMDFDDLIMRPVELFTTNLALLHKWQLKIRYLLVDEYQDTNLCQYQLIKLLVGSRDGLTLVGDDDQSIYAWRGANSENLSNLQEDYPNLKLIKLEQNYRSTLTILNAANSVIQNNPKLFEKKLWSELGLGSPIRIIACKNEATEAESVVRKIMLHQLSAQGKFSDYAILYRSNFQSRSLEEALRNYKLPYTISGGQSFFAKTEIKDLTAYLRLILNSEDDNAFIRAITTPKRGIGEGSLAKLTNYSLNRKISLFEAMFEEGFLSQVRDDIRDSFLYFGALINNLEFREAKECPALLLNELLGKINYQEYLYDNFEEKVATKAHNNVLSMIEWLAKKGEQDNKSLKELAQMVNLITLLEDGEEEANAIKLSTLHAAKGLEFPYVYLISCEEGILPHQESILANGIEEERRLMYVGITRAQQELTLSYCEERRKSGGLEKVDPSRFIAELGENNIINEAKRRFEKITDKEELVGKLQALKDLLNK